MLLLKNYNKFHQLKLSVILLVSFVCLFSDCYKEVGIKNETYYFMRGVFVNDTFPEISLFVNSLADEKPVNLSDYEVTVYSDKGETETMQNGKFTKIKCRVGTKYTVRWKLNIETEWQSLDKYIPNPDTVNINSSKLITETERLYFKDVKIPSTDMFFWDVDWGNINGYGIYNWLGDDGYTLLMKSTSSGYLQIYPTDVWNATDMVPLKPCTRPYNFYLLNGFTKLYLLQCSKKDIDLFKQIKENFSNFGVPFYTGEPAEWDYINGNHIGHIFSYYKYTNISLPDLIPGKDLEEVNYSVHFNKDFKDSNDVFIREVGFIINGLNDQHFFGSSYFEFPQKKQLFFKDYIASLYNLYLKKPCGYYHPEYNFKVYVKYAFFNHSADEYYYVTNETYKYNYIGFHIPINIE